MAAVLPYFKAFTGPWTRTVHVYGKYVVGDISGFEQTIRNFLQTRPCKSLLKHGSNITYIYTDTVSVNTPLTFEYVQTMVYLPNVIGQAEADNVPAAASLVSLLLPFS